MSRIPRIAPLAVLLLALAPLSGCAAEPDMGPNGPGVPVSVGEFRDDLAPYGQWIQTSAYGEVWRPNAAPGYEPYSTDGHWIFTEYGWVFDSESAWAPVVYHYGRWVQDPALGWVWAPGTEWGPAWVDWRIGGPYVGWAVLGPGSLGYIGPFRFVHAVDFVRPNGYIAARVVREDEARTALSATAGVPPTAGGWHTGPSAEHLHAITGAKVTRVSYGSRSGGGHGHLGGGHASHR